jgi:L-ascorbate metabolism protein UlaG (beta-lactamase superfamily)
MKVKWLGHACFLLTSDAGPRVVTDPYTPGAFGCNYGPPSETADVVTVSHQHQDHNNVKDVRGNPQVVTGAGSQMVKGVEFKGVATSHDEASGSQRGSNTVFCFTLDGVRVCHLGDLGHDLSPDQVSEIGPVDVLLIPTGGNFTIDASMADRVADRLAARIVIPMHFNNDRCPTFPVAGVEEFEKRRKRARRVDGSELEVAKEQLPAETETVILRPCC